MFFPRTGRAQTWLASPISGDWNTAANRTAGGPPNNGGTAFFDQSAQTSISIPAGAAVFGTTFNADASAYTISTGTSTLSFLGGVPGWGVVNNSAYTQNFVNSSVANGQTAALINFILYATAGSNVVYTNSAATTNDPISGEIIFSNNATAGSASFVSYGAVTTGLEGGSIIFKNNSSAGSGTFTNNGPTVNTGTLGIPILGRVKVKQRVKDESDMDESSEHDIKFFKT